MEKMKKNERIMILKENYEREVASLNDEDRRRQEEADEFINKCKANAKMKFRRLIKLIIYAAIGLILVLTIGIYVGALPMKDMKIALPYIGASVLMGVIIWQWANKNLIKK